MTDLPADWAIKKALKECEDPSAESAFPFLQVATVDQLKNLECEVLGRKLILAHARLIEQTQQAPVDRKLQCAREAAASLFEGNKSYAAAIRMGRQDKTCDTVVAGEKAIALFVDGFGD